MRDALLLGFGGEYLLREARFGPTAIGAICASQHVWAKTVKHQRKTKQVSKLTCTCATAVCGHVTSNDL